MNVFSNIAKQTERNIDLVEYISVADVSVLRNQIKLIELPKLVLQEGIQLSSSSGLRGRGAYLNVTPYEAKRSW